MIVSVVQYGTQGVDEIAEKGMAMIEAALDDKPGLIVLQELFNTAYFPQYKDKRHFCHGEPIPGKTTERILKVIGGTSTVVVAPIFEKEGESYFCSAAIIDARNGVIGVYRKLHIPSVPTIHENYFFKPGDHGHAVFETEAGTLGIMLCYDRHFPESARLYGLAGADILCVAAATPKSARDIWFTEMRAHAFSNRYHLACANRSGTEDDIQFLGTSFICDPGGRVLAQAGEDEDAVIHAEVDIDGARESRKNSPFYRDRRPGQYEGISR
jgi:N-carbamoylputrescine amidase